MKREDSDYSSAVYSPPIISSSEMSKSSSSQLTTLQNLKRAEIDMAAVSFSISQQFYREQYLTRNDRFAAHRFLHDFMPRLYRWFHTRRLPHVSRRCEYMASRRRCFRSESLVHCHCKLSFFLPSKEIELDNFANCRSEPFSTLSSSSTLSQID